MSTITVHSLHKTYRVPMRESGVMSAFRSVFRRAYRSIPAVSDISFDVGAGEVVGFIGPNGAGKTTTMKMLAGILTPTSGSLEVLGHTPGQRRPEFLKSIALIRGSKPIGGPGELTVMDNLRFQQLIYEIPEARFANAVNQLTSILDLGQLLDRQTRALSLGERMRAGLAMSLVYEPKVVFLDEPTIGLDVSAVHMFHDFVQRYTHDAGATVLLTSHSMADVETLCQRILFIDHGQLQFDGSLREFRRGVIDANLVSFVPKPGSALPPLEQWGAIVASEEDRIILRVDRAHVSDVVGSILGKVDDLSIEEPPLSMVVRHAYDQAVPS